MSKAKRNSRLRILVVERFLSSNRMYLSVWLLFVLSELLSPSRSGKYYKVIPIQPEDCVTSLHNSERWCSEDTWHLYSAPQCWAQSIHLLWMWYRTPKLHHTTLWVINQLGSSLIPATQQFTTNSFLLSLNHVISSSHYTCFWKITVTTIIPVFLAENLDPPFALLSSLLPPTLMHQILSICLGIGLFIYWSIVQPWSRSL